MEKQNIVKVTDVKIKLQKCYKNKLPELVKQYRQASTSDLLRLILLDYIINPKTLSLSPLEVYDNKNVEIEEVATTLTEGQIETLKALSKNILKLKSLYTLIIEDFIDNPRDLQVDFNIIDD